MTKHSRLTTADCVLLTVLAFVLGLAAVLLISDPALRIALWEDLQP